MKPIAALIFMCVVIQINGFRKVSDGKYPYQVSLRNNWKHYCGGSILNKRWILTAAYCVDKRFGLVASNIKVTLGWSKLSEGDPDVYQADYVVHHEKYNLFDNDIGLVRVDRDIEFNDRVQPVKLPSEDFAKDDYSVKVIGWLYDLIFDRKYVSLMEIEMKTIGRQQCNYTMNLSSRILKRQITESHICALPETGEDLCYGFEGGALVADGVQIGIVSNYDVCSISRPDVYANVYTYLDWINEKINEHF